MSDTGEKVYCTNCIYFIQHIHPFYPGEIMRACLSNPSLKNNFMQRRYEYADPAEKNKLNDCQEYKAKLSVKIRLFVKKILRLGL